MSSKILHLWKIVILCVIVLTFLPTFALPDETYVFERMWPTLQQPWYFLSPQGVAVGNNNIYVADTGNHRIQKFTRDGQFVTEWGSSGIGSGEFLYTAGIAIDNNENVYVLDYLNHRIQKFSSEGHFITKWGSAGTGNGQFKFPPVQGYATTWCGIGIDASGNIYISDSGNNRIQKFTPKGQFIRKLGSSGSEDGQFNLPTGIAIDAEGYLYVADTGNNRIQKFNADGPNEEGCVQKFLPVFKNKHWVSKSGSRNALPLAVISRLHR